VKKRKREDNKKPNIKREEKAIKNTKTQKGEKG
jgi:hypothetical protein